MPQPGSFDTIMAGTGDATIIPAPTAPAFISVTELILTASAVSVVTVKSGSETIGTHYLGANSNVVPLENKEGVYNCNPGEAFVINPSAGNVGAVGKYTIRGAG